MRAKYLIILISILGASALFFLLSRLDSCGQKVKALGAEISIEKRVLSNGLVVVLVPDQTVPIVSLQLFYRVGSVDEHDGQTGLAHLFEHLMFKGTSRFGEKQFFHQLEAKGAEVNAYTTRDFTVFYENFVPDLLPKALEMEADRMLGLQLSESLLVRERKVVLEERALRTDSSPDGRMQESLWNLAYAVHPYQRPVIGYPQDLEGLTVETVMAFYKKYYQPANAVLVLTGDFSPNSTWALVKNSFGVLPRGARPERKLRAEPLQNEEHRLTLRDRTASERFSLGYHVTSAHQDDSYALDVLSNILFEGTSSRAYRKMVLEKDRAIGISGSAYTPAYPGLFLISATAKQGVSAESVQADLYGVISEVQDKGVEVEEISAAVKQLTLQLIDGVRTPYGLGQLIGTVELIFDDPRRFSDDLNKYLRVSQADVQRVARKYLNPNNRTVVTLVPEKNGEETP